MSWTSWLRILATTRRTTSICRKLRTCSSKILRWNRMYLFLRADQRLKQNREGPSTTCSSSRDCTYSWKKHGLILNQELNSIKRTPVGKKTKYSSSARRITFEKKMVRSNAGDWRLSSEQNWALSQYWSGWCVEEQDGRRRRQTRKDFNAVTDLSMTKFFTSELFKVIQDATSLILHCRTMCEFQTISSSTFITSDAQSIYTPSQIQELIAGGQNLSKRQTVFFTSMDPMNKEHKDLETVNLKTPASCTIHADSVEETSKHGVLVDIQTCSKERIKFPSKHDRTPSFFTIHSQPIASRRLPRWKLEKSCAKKCMRHLGPPPKISLRNNWMKELDSEVARQAESSQPTQPNPNPIHRTGRLLRQNKRPVRILRKATTRFSLDCENTNLSIERSDQDKDAGTKT